MRKIMSFLTSLFMILFSLPVYSSAFSDMPDKSNRFYPAFVYAVEKKLIAGDGTNVNPNGLITPAEALTIASRIKSFDCDETDITAFGVSRDSWYYSTVAKAYTLGYISADALSEVNSPASKAKLFAILSSIYGKLPSQTADESLCTRAEFIWEIYYMAPDGYISATEEATKGADPSQTEGASESSSEFTDLKAKAAKEAMQVALGLNPDGSSYITNVVYTDNSQTDWQSGRVTSSRSDRPTNSKPKDDPTEGPTEPEEDEPTEAPTEAPTEGATEEPTEEPSYGDYDGPIDNGNDNTVDDPFNDGWRPPGWIDDNDEGQDGWDGEDDDFGINDADDPDYNPDSDKDDPTDEPSSDPTDEPTDEPTGEPTDEPSDNPSDEPSDEPTDEPSDNPSDTDKDNPPLPDTDTPSDTDKDIPADTDKDIPSDTDKNDTADSSDEE